MIRRSSLAVWAVLGAAGLAALVVLGGGDDDGRATRVSMVVPRATAIKPGFNVKLDGRAVGSVHAVELQPDYRVRLTVELDEEGASVPDDSRFVARTGGTIKLGDRFLEVRRGKSDTPLRDGQQLPASRYVDPVEFDDVFRVFTAPVRADIKTTLAKTARAMEDVETGLGPALRHGPAAAVSVESITGQLGQNTAALRRLVRSTSAVTRSAAAANPGLRELITSADTTFTALAQESVALKQAIADLPSTLVRTRALADRATPTLRAARALTDDLAPGTDQLKAVAAPLASLLGTVQDVGPTGTTTLRTLAHAAPDLDELLAKLRRPVMPRVEGIGREAAKQLDCLRPYTPEIAGLMSVWAGFFGIGDKSTKFARAQAGIVPFSSETPGSSADLKRLMGSAYRPSFPRPPGQLVDQPWFQPQCGITEDALDPAKDPEVRQLDPDKPLLSEEPDRTPRSTK